MAEIGEVRELDITERLRYQHVMVGGCRKMITPQLWMEIKKMLEILAPYFKHQQQLESEAAIKRAGILYLLDPVFGEG